MRTEMIWYKSWLDTRWAFLIGLALLMCSAAAIVFTYPRVLKLMPLVPAMDVGGEIGRRIREAAQLSSEYRGYIWSQWFRQNPIQLGTLFAVLLGSGGMVSHGALFTLSLPISRNRLLGVRAATGLVEWLGLAFAPSLLIPLLSPAVGATYGIGSALVHGACVFVGGAVFFSLALLLSTMFTDVWRPLLITCSVAVMLGLSELVLGDLLPFGVFRMMTGEAYFRTGTLPLGGMLAGALAAAALLYGARTSFARRDF